MIDLAGVVKTRERLLQWRKACNADDYLVRGNTPSQVVLQRWRRDRARLIALIAEMLQ